MGFFEKKKSFINREVALKARPEQLPTVSREEISPNELKIKVRLKRVSWQTFLGAGPEVEKTFLLDKFGREVYEFCDGKTTVEKIVKKFADNHKVSIAEAEKSITTFLKTLMSKGMVAMVIDRGEK